MIINQNDTKQTFFQLLLLTIPASLFLSVIIGVEFNSVTMAFVMLGICDGLMILFLSFWYMIYCKVIEIDSEGYAIILPYLYRKKFTWEQTKTTNLEDFYLCLHVSYGGSQTGFEGALFAKHRAHRPWWMSPAFYCVFHPLSCFYVVFVPPWEKRQNIPFAVKKEDFLKYMEECKIQLYYRRFLARFYKDQDRKKP